MDHSEIIVLAMAKEANPWWFAFIFDSVTQFTTGTNKAQMNEQIMSINEIAFNSGSILRDTLNVESWRDEIERFSKLPFEYTKRYPLMSEEVIAFVNAKQKNFFWYVFIMNCAMIMVQRRNKYSRGHHPYFNFADVSRRSGVSMFDVFKVYVAMKESRASVSGDVEYSDESSMDTQIDNVNYTAIEYGAIMSGMTAEEVWRDDSLFSS